MNKGRISGNRMFRNAAVLTFLAAVLVLAGCGRTGGAVIEEGKVNVVTTFYPIYEFAREIGGDDANVINLLPVGVEPHDWTPRSQDIASTSKAELFLYNGAGLEGWVPGFLKGLDAGSGVKAVAVSEGVDYILTDEDDGHGHGETGHDHDHDDHDHDHDDHNDDDHDHDDHEHAESGETAEPSSLHIDPHTWTSPKSALVMAENIKNSLQEADPANTEGYEERYEALADRLRELDKRFEQELTGLTHNEIVVSHQAFGYLARDYGLTQHSIMGLSPDAEPRGQDIVRLANLVKDEGIRYIFFEELVSDRLAKTLAAEAGVETLVLNPVEGLTQEQEKNGDNYFTLMEKNLQNLILALQ